jgi:hypothetical protein
VKNVRWELQIAFTLSSVNGGMIALSQKKPQAKNVLTA